MSFLSQAKNLPTEHSQGQSGANPVLVRLMLLMFFAAFGRGMSAPWINLYLSEAGLSATTIGILLGIGSFIELSGTPLLNNIADRRRRHRLLHVLQLSLYAICMFLLATVAHLWVIAVVIMFIELGKRPAIVLGLQLALSRIQQLDKDIVGRVRAGTALGFGSANLMVTFVYGIAQYTGMFIVAGFSTLIAMALSPILPKHTDEEAEKDRTKAEVKVPRNRGFYFLMAAQFFVILGLRSGWEFWLIHFRDNLGVNIENIGLLLAFMAFVEVPFFIAFDSVVRRFDVRKTYLFGVTGTAFIWILVGFAPSAAWIVPILILRGSVFGMYHLSILILISRISHPTNVATNQALLQITVPGVAILLGGPAMGWTYDHLGPEVFFTLCTIFTLFGASIAAYAYKHLQRDKVETQPALVPQEG